jgi:hypothetical protein
MFASSILDLLIAGPDAPSSSAPASGPRVPFHSIPLTAIISKRMMHEKKIHPLLLRLFSCIPYLMQQLFMPFKFAKMADFGKACKPVTKIKEIP